MTHEELAEKLLTPLWRGIPPDYKAKYARNIWEQFENNLRSAAYTARLPEFLQHVTARLGIRLTEPHLAGVVEVVSGAPEPRRVLKMLREDTTLLVLLVRVANEQRRDALAALQKGN
jgi:hypothetical protein